MADDSSPGFQINHHFFSSVLLGLLSMVVALGGTLSAEWADGAALIGGADVFTTVKLALWYGMQYSHQQSQRRSFYYGWCEQGTGAFDAEYCFDLQATRVGCCAGINLIMVTVVLSSLLSTYVVKSRLEPTIGRVAAVIAAVAGVNFLMAVAVWARLVLSISAQSQKDAAAAGSNLKAQLNLGVSWLAMIGAFVLAKLTAVSLYYASKRVDVEMEEQAKILAAQQAEKRHGKERRRSKGERRHGKQADKDEEIPEAVAAEEERYGNAPGGVTGLMGL